LTTIRAFEKCALFFVRFDLFTTRDPVEEHKVCLCFFMSMFIFMFVFVFVFMSAVLWFLADQSVLTEDWWGLQLPSSSSSLDGRRIGKFSWI
jgi:hypothetical protein